MPEKYDVIIIGAGIGGLVCGCYLAKGGYKVLILEQHTQAGGYCTSFLRKGYKFDAAVHYIGSLKKGVLNKVLNDLELTNVVKFNQFDPTDKIIVADNTAYIRANPYDTIKEFQKSFPREKNKIEAFFTYILEEDIIRIFPKILRLTFNDILNEYFTDEVLKAALGCLILNMGSSPSRVSALTSIVFYKEFILDPGYYPEGGIQAFPNALVSRLKAYKGEILFSKKVSKILTKNNKAEGVVLEDGSKIISDWVISNIDATTTFKELVNIETPESHSVEKLQTSFAVTALYLGINKDISMLIKESCSVWYLKTHGIDKYLSNLENNFFNEELPMGMICFPSLHDPTVKEKNNTIQIFIPAPYSSIEFWNRNREMISNKILDFLKMLYPAIIKDSIEIKVMATPFTFQRYTANKCGAIYGWESIPNQIHNQLVPQNTSITNLILTGHWCTSSIGEGGVSGVAGLARNAAMYILARAKPK